MMLAKELKIEGRYVHHKSRGTGLNMFWSTCVSFLPLCLIIKRRKSVKKKFTIRALFDQRKTKLTTKVIQNKRKYHNQSTRTQNKNQQNT